MNYSDPIPPDPRAMDAAVTLGEAIRQERGRYGLRTYLTALAECMPHPWVREVAKRLDHPSPPEPRPHPFDPTPPNEPEPPRDPMPPPEPRQKPPDVEKLLRLMQIVGSMKS